MKKEDILLPDKYLFKSSRFSSGSNKVIKPGILSISQHGTDGITTFTDSTLSFRTHGVGGGREAVSLGLFPAFCRCTVPSARRTLRYSELAFVKLIRWQLLCCKKLSVSPLHRTYSHGPRFTDHYLTRRRGGWKETLRWEIHGTAGWKRGF